ncbi:M14 family metallopeptidase [Aridibaculum aurantiacum]|uniref:M14 family metallopeptidase n=1 Tax=Aridibaculum aurantiacum TaxID=2810307 RepID=UPI001A979353|nr:M14 family metallopeptidase [Aridibaculum aurantiacum]
MIKRIAACICVALSISHYGFSQTDYSNYAQQSSRINSLGKSYSQLAKVASIAKTAGGKDIWMITIGTGITATKPAIAVVGGVEGNHLLGTELAIGFAEKLLQGSSTDSIRNLLNKTTFYIYPNMSPDAMEQYFAKLRYERQGNASQTDDDRDGRTNEDGYDDLDGNGKITQMRVASPIGEWRTHPDDARILIKADLAKNEKGKYLLLIEGIDNDKDGNLNEDGEGGVWFNKNFSYKHPSFTQGSGEFAVSEPETRALLDRMYEQFNIYAVVSFGSNNNLSTPLAFNAQQANQKLVAGLLEPDAKANAMVSDLYNKVTSMKDAPKTTAAGGDFLSWAYFHYGRHSFSTPGWYIPKAKADTAKKEKPLSVDDASANYLRWATQNNITPAFTEWKKVNHPDYPNQTVEVGGLDPFVLINPPYAMVDSIVRKHTTFLTRLAALQPEVDITNVQTEKLGNNITRITATVMNKGALASHSKLGERTYWVKRIVVKMDTNNNQSVLSGKKNQVLNSLEGYSSETLTWLVRGTGKVTLEAGSPTTGTKRIDINL